MSNSFFDWVAKSAAARFIAGSRVRAKQVNDALDEVTAGFDKLPTPAQLWGGTGAYALAGGSVDAWTATIASTYLTAHADGLTIRVKFADANTSATPTLNVNGLGAKAIERTNGAAIVPGEIAAGTIATLVYNSTFNSWQLVASVLTDPPAFSARLSANTSIPDGNDTKLVCNSEAYDLGGNYNAATGRFVAPVSGIYSFKGVALLDTVGFSTGGYLALFKNGALYLYGPDIRLPGEYMGLSIDGDVQLSASDYVELYIYHSTGSARNAIGSSSFITWFQGHLVRAGA